VRREEIVFEQLQAALHHRTVVEQAKGVLAEHGGLDMNQAYVLLRDYARAHQRRLSDLARDVATGMVDLLDLIAWNAGARRP
jgi:AmiR/NasT family two-component response regulator